MNTQNLTDTLHLPKMPAAIEKLPRNARGYPVPFFVAWIDGVPDFRVVRAETWTDAVRNRKCWICGEPLGAQGTFAIGPMCSVNRINSEPPSHRKCAEFAVKACPFMLRPNMVRREDERTESSQPFGGIMIKRNPGVIALWSTRSWEPFHDGHGGRLIRLGEPTHITWWREGRLATRAEVNESIDTGIPLLRDACRGGDEAESRALDRAIIRACQLVEATTAPTARAL